MQQTANYVVYSVVSSDGEIPQSPNTSNRPMYLRRIDDYRTRWERATSHFR